MGAAPCAVAGNGVTGEIEAGVGPGASAKSAKSENDQSAVNGFDTKLVDWFLTVVIRWLSFRTSKETLQIVCHWEESRALRVSVLLVEKTSCTC